jgi:hypothetical protein
VTDTALSPEEQLIEDIAGFTHDPLGYALYAFPWGEEGTELAHATGPRQWQADAFREIRDHLQNPETRYQPLMLARASGHGIGKSAFISMLINWGMSTCEDCKVVVTANTDNQLRTKTWPEIIKWSNLAITKDWFTCTATAMYSNDPGHDKRWRADAIPWSEHNTEAFAGLHNERKRIIVVFDEASNIADLVWEVAEGALTDEDTEIIWVAFGNPTRNTGRFRECFRKYKHRWKTAQIDSRTVEGTNKQQLQKWVDEKERQVRCKICGAVVEPFDWMLSVAKRETRLADDVKLLRQEEQERRKNIEKLIQIERNAKARIRRATKSRTE